MKLKLLFLFVVSHVGFGAESGPKRDFPVVQDLTEEWHIYDEESGKYMPYIKGISPLNPAHSVFLDTDKYRHFSLMVESTQPNSYLFINGQFYRNLFTDSLLIIPIGNLRKYGKNLVISFYGSANTNTKKIFIGSKIDVANTPTGIVRENLLNMKIRQPFTYANSLLLLFCFLLVFITILSSVNPMAFNEYFNLGDIFVVKIRDTKFLISKPLNQINLAYVVLLSNVTALFYLLMTAAGIYLFQDQVGLLESSSKVYVLILFLKAAFVSFMAYLAKYFYLSITGNLFGLGKSVNIHFFKVIQFSLFFFSILIITFYGLLLSPHSKGINFPETLLWLAILVYSLRTFIVYLTILKSTNIQSLYLFAYLCVVEILPIFIGIRFAF